MKKIVSLLSASVLALSLIGCSGDLHDTDVSPLFIEGDCWGTRTALAFDGDEQVIEFKYEDNDDHKKWGGSAGTVNFKIMTEAVGWNDDFGAAKDETLELKINDDFTETHSRKNEGIGGAGPGNIVLKDLAEGSKYKIHVKYDSAANTAKIKVTGNVTDWPALRLEGKDGTTYKLERTGSIYKYTFTPEKEGSLEFYISNGYLYWGANETVNLEEKNVDMSTTKPTEYLKATWSKANIPYSISIDAKDILKDGDKPVSVKFAVAYTTILSKAALQGIGNSWDAGSANLTCESETVYTYEFTNTGSEMEFAIQREAGSWDKGRWFAGIPEGKERAATGLAGDIVAAKYNATATSVTPIYYPKDAGMDGKNLKVTGLPYKAGYKFKMTITIVNPATNELTIAVAANQEGIPNSDYDSTNFDSCYKLNNIAWICSSHGNYQITWGSKESDGSYLGTVTIPSGAEDSWGGKPCVEFGVTDTESWGTKFTGATLSAEDTFVELTKGAGDNNKISAVTGTLSSDLVITLKSTADKISAKYTY